MEQHYQWLDRARSSIGDALQQLASSGPSHSVMLQSKDVDTSLRVETGNLDNAILYLEHALIDLRAVRSRRG